MAASSLLASGVALGTAAVLVEVLAGIEQHIGQRNSYLPRCCKYSHMKPLSKHWSAPIKNAIRCPCKARREAFHAVRQSPAAVRLNNAVSVIGLNRIVNYPKPMSHTALRQRVTKRIDEVAVAQ